MNSTENDKIIRAIIENDQTTLHSIVSKGGYCDSIYAIDVNQNRNSNNNFYERHDERTDNLINDRISLLHIAAYYDSLECFCYLSEVKKINLRILSSRSFMPIHYACYNGSREVATYILEKDEEQADYFGNNVLLCFSIQGCSPEILELLFRKGAILRKAKSKMDDPIEKGICTDNYRCCEILMRYAEGYCNDFTPAMTAAKMVNPMLVKYLVKSSEDLEFSDRVQQSVFTLIFEISNGQGFREMIVDWLTKYEDLVIDPPDNIQMNGVCHWICKMADMDIAKLMLRTKNISINRVGDGDHLGPFYLANKNSITDKQIIDILGLLVSNGFDLNFQLEILFIEPVLKTFLRTITIRYPVIEFLVANGADPNLPWTPDRKTTILDQIKKRKEDKKLMTIFAKYLE